MQEEIGKVFIGNANYLNVPVNNLFESLPNLASTFQSVLYDYLSAKEKIIWEYFKIKYGREITADDIKKMKVNISKESLDQFITYEGKFFCIIRETSIHENSFAPFAISDRIKLELITEYK